MSDRCFHTAACLSLFLLIGSADAGMTQRLSLPQLAEQADVIVRGRIEETKIRSSGNRSFSITRVLVSIEEQFKGDKAATLAIELPVGTLGDVVQGSPGTPEFSPGEEVILFLQRQRKQASYRLIGGKQGKFLVMSEPGSGRKLVEDLTRHTESYESFVERLTKILKSKT